jgi:hypothetical protein
VNKESASSANPAEATANEAVNPEGNVAPSTEAEAPAKDASAIIQKTTGSATGTSSTPALTGPSHPPYLTVKDAKGNVTQTLTVGEVISARKALVQGMLKRSEEAFKRLQRDCASLDKGADVSSPLFFLPLLYSSPRVV